MLSPNTVQLGAILDHTETYIHGGKSWVARPESSKGVVALVNGSPRPSKTQDVPPATPNPQAGYDYLNGVVLSPPRPLHNPRVLVVGTLPANRSRIADGLPIKLSGPLPSERIAVSTHVARWSTIGNGVRALASCGSQQVIRRGHASTVGPWCHAIFCIG
jgi:hypothetical protein